MIYFEQVYKGTWNHTTFVALKCTRADGQEEFYNEMKILL